MRRKKDQRPGRYERSGGRRAWEWLLVQVKHTWYQAGPQTPNTMDLHGHLTPSSRIKRGRNTSAARIGDNSRCPGH